MTPPPTQDTRPVTPLQQHQRLTSSALDPADPYIDVKPVKSHSDKACHFGAIGEHQHLRHGSEQDHDPTQSSSARSSFDRYDTTAADDSIFDSSLPSLVNTSSTTADDSAVLTSFDSGDDSDQAPLGTIGAKTPWSSAEQPDEPPLLSLDLGRSAAQQQDLGHNFADSVTAAQVVSQIQSSPEFRTMAQEYNPFFQDLPGRQQPQQHPHCAPSVFGNHLASAMAPHASTPVRPARAFARPLSRWVEGSGPIDTFAGRFSTDGWPASSSPMSPSPLSLPHSDWNNPSGASWKTTARPQDLMLRDDTVSSSNPMTTRGMSDSTADSKRAHTLDPKTRILHRPTLDGRRLGRAKCRGAWGLIPHCRSNNSADLQNPPQLRAQLAMQEAENSRLADQCTSMSDQVYCLQKALKSASPNGDGGGRIASEHGAANSHVTGADASPSLKYVGLSLFNTIQSQLQADMNLDSPSHTTSKAASPCETASVSSCGTPSPNASLNGRGNTASASGSSTTSSCPGLDPLASHPNASAIRSSTLPALSHSAAPRAASPAAPTTPSWPHNPYCAPFSTLHSKAPPFVPSALAASNASVPSVAAVAQSPLARSPQALHRSGSNGGLTLGPSSIPCATGVPYIHGSSPLAHDATQDAYRPFDPVFDHHQRPLATPFLRPRGAGVCSPPLPYPGRPHLQQQQQHALLDDVTAAAAYVHHPLHRVPRDHSMLLDPPVAPVAGFRGAPMPQQQPHHHPVQHPRSHHAVLSSLAPEALVAQALSGRSQEGSIILQQQLKSGTPDRQASILRALAPHLSVLSEDKHGNFLVQRAIGVDGRLAWELKGHFARLALSQYGCHVVQRVLDEDEPIKMQVVDELLAENLMETLTSRNSVHVWAKALETKWTDEAFRRRLYETINRVMRGRWAATAMQETGSIVVQNLFESAEDDEKQDCVEEILDRLGECVTNQWGVWVAQHIIEYGSDEHRKVAFEKLLADAAVLSLSQYGQKAVMTALKKRDEGFVRGYIDRLCGTCGACPKAAIDDKERLEEGNEGAMVPYTPSKSDQQQQQQQQNQIHHPSGRRSMLVDVASTPQGLQIMTQLLTTVTRQDRERIINAVRKNSVFLKGSKTGLKVHQVCERARAFTGY